MYLNHVYIMWCEIISKGLAKTCFNRSSEEYMLLFFETQLFKTKQTIIKITCTVSIIINWIVRILRHVVESMNTPVHIPAAPVHIPEAPVHIPAAPVHYTCSTCTHTCSTCTHTCSTCTHSTCTHTCISSQLSVYTGYHSKGLCHSWCDILHRIPHLYLVVHSHRTHHHPGPLLQWKQNKHRYYNKNKHNFKQN